MLNISLILILAVLLVPNKAFLIIVNQYGEIISSKVQIVVIGGHAYLYNQTHWIIESNLSEVIVKVYRLNICVGEFKIKMGKVYKLKVLVSHMIIQTPKTIVFRIHLLGTNYTWTLTGKTNYILEDMPHATYKIQILGTNFKKVIYWEGGVISIGKKYEINIDFIMKTLPFIIILPLATSIALKNRRRRKRKRARASKVRRKAKRNRHNELKRREKLRIKPKTLAEAILKTEVDN